MGVSQGWTMRQSDEVKTENVFRAFIDYATPLMDSGAGAEQLLGELRRDADTYRQLAQLDNATPEGKYYHGVYPGGISGEEDDITSADVAAYETAVGRKVAWVYFSHN